MLQAAFTESNALASWLPPYGFLCTVHEMNVKVGGTFRMSFHNFSTGDGHSFGGEYSCCDTGRNVLFGLAGEFGEIG